MDTVHLDTIRCVVTGALGNVGYQVSFLVASGAFFDGKKKIILNLLEVPALKDALEGLKMELEDCAFENLEVHVGSDPYEMFQDVDCAFLVGAAPRGPGMERKDLLLKNGSIFQEQGKALDRVAKKNARILVTGNPCNTNCLIALHNAPSLSPKQFFALTTLDEFRARALVAKKTMSHVADVSSVTIWGNHSATLVPDTTNTTIGKNYVNERLDKNWLHTEFLTAVRQRGAEIIKARGKSSAASAAIATVALMKTLLAEKEQEASLAVYSQNNPYGIDPDLVFSFPCLVSQKGYKIISSRKPDEALWKEVLLSEKELKEERDAIRHLL